MTGVTLRLVIAGVVGMAPVVDQGGAWTNLTFLFPDGRQARASGNGKEIIPSHVPMLWYAQSNLAATCTDGQHPDPLVPRDPCVKPRTRLRVEPLSCENLAEPQLLEAHEVLDISGLELTVSANGHTPAGEPALEAMRCTRRPDKPSDLDCDAEGLGLAALGVANQEQNDVRWVPLLRDLVDQNREWLESAKPSCVGRDEFCDEISARVRVDRGLVRVRKVIRDQDGSFVRWKRHLVGSSDIVAGPEFLPEAVEIFVHYPNATSVSIFQRHPKAGANAQEALRLYPRPGESLVEVWVENAPPENLVRAQCEAHHMDLAHAELAYLPFANRVKADQWFVPIAQKDGGVIRIDPPSCPPVFQIGE